MLAKHICLIIGHYTTFLIKLQQIMLQQNHFRHFAKFIPLTFVYNAQTILIIRKK